MSLQTPPHYRGPHARRSPAPHDKENMFLSPNRLTKMNEAFTTPFKELIDSPARFEDKAVLRKRIEEEAYKAKQLKLLNSTLISRLKETSLELERSREHVAEAEQRISTMGQQMKVLEAEVHDKDVDLVSVSKQLALQEQANRELQAHMKELEELRLEVIALRESKQQVLVDMEGLRFEKDKEVERLQAEIEERQITREKELGELLETVATLRREQAQLRGSLEAIETKKNEVALTLDRMFGEVRTYREACRMREQENQQLRAEYAELEHQRSQLLCEIETLRQRLEAMSKELETTRLQSTLFYKIRSLLGNLFTYFTRNN
jgi:chromosome segregation ATPase